MLTGTTLTAAGIDAVALKPSEVDVSRASALDVDVVTVDYEGVEHPPAPETRRRARRRARRSAHDAGAGRRLRPAG